MLNNRTDAELAQDFLDGKPEAFNEIDRRFRDRLIRFVIRRNLCMADEAEDRVQEALFRASQKLEQLQKTDLLAPWLFRITVRICLDESKKKMPTPETALSERFMQKEVADIGQMDPSEEPIRRELRENLWHSAATSLSDEEFRVLWMHYVEELDLAQIAREIQKRSGTVRVQLHRIRRKLVSILSDFH